MSAFDINKIRSEFPILCTLVHKQPLIYFDNGATSQKPLRVINRTQQLMAFENSNIHRGVHFLSDQMTQQYELARINVQKFINAEFSEEIIFTSGATESINLVAFSFSQKFLHKDEEIIVSVMEHHANIVPWQMACERVGARLRAVPVLDDGSLDMKAYERMFNDKTKLVAITHASNVLATMNPAKKLVEVAHANDVVVLIDGSQSIQHGTIDVKDMDADFFVFSGHKVYGPTGIGVLYGKKAWLDRLPVWKTGGDMVDKVSFEKTTFNALPLKFEAGTSNYIGAIGLSEALSFLTDTGLECISAHEKTLSAALLNTLLEFPEVQIIGNTSDRVPLVSFNIKGAHFYDAGMILDKMGIAVRTGTHCAQPLMARFGIEGSIRASLALYNTKDEISVLKEKLKKVITMLA